MNALLYFQNQQPQAWHEGLELNFNVVDRFNIQSSNKMWAHSKYWACSNYIFRIHVGLRNELMEALQKKKNLSFWIYKSK